MSIKANKLDQNLSFEKKWKNAMIVANKIIKTLNQPLLQFIYKPAKNGPSYGAA